MRNGLTLEVMTIMRKQISNNYRVTDYCIIGTGNIAMRHLKNVRKLSPNKSIEVVKRSTSKTNSVKLDKYVSLSNDLNNIKARNKKSVAIICSPASLHEEDALICARNGFNILVEKPFSIRHSSFKKFKKILNNNNLKFIVGYNLIFTDRMTFLKKIIDGKKYGKLISASINVQTDFAKWRKIPYKDTVSYHKSLGGGVINELSHEIDYVNYLFGKPYKVIVKDLSNHKKIHVETSIIAILKYKDMSSVNLTLNMKSKEDLRISQIILESAIITIDHNLNKIIILNNKTKIIKRFNDNIGKSYIRELKYLIKLISRNIKSSLILKNIEQTNSSLIAMHSSLKDQKLYLIK